MAKKSKKAAAAPTEPQSGHAQAVDPGKQAAQATTQVPPAAAPSQGGTATSTPHAGTGLTSLQDILPEINSLAQRVGGLKKLAEIIATLQQSKEP